MFSNNINRLVLLLVKVISNTKLVIIPQLPLGKIPGDFNSETETLDLRIDLVSPNQGIGLDKLQQLVSSPFSVTIIHIYVNC